MGKFTTTAKGDKSDPQYCMAVTDDLLQIALIKLEHAAIPSLLASIAGWCAAHGATEILRGSFERAIKMTHELDAVTKRERN